MSVCKCLRAPANPSFTMPVLKLLSDSGSVRTQVSFCYMCVCVCLLFVSSPKLCCTLKTALSCSYLPRRLQLTLVVAALPDAKLECLGRFFFELCVLLLKLFCTLLLQCLQVAPSRKLNCLQHFTLVVWQQLWLWLKLYFVAKSFVHFWSLFISGSDSEMLLSTGLIISATLKLAPGVMRHEPMPV